MTYTAPVRCRSSLCRDHFLEELILNLVRHAGAAVPDLEEHHLTVAGNIKVNDALASFISLDGVDDQIVDHLHEALISPFSSESIDRSQRTSRRQEKRFSS